MSLVNKIKDIFSSSGPSETVEKDIEKDNEKVPTADPVSIIEPPPLRPEPVQEPASLEPETPAVRETIQAPVLSQDDSPEDSDKILIKAQPSQASDQCVFRVNRTLLKNYSWYFANFESAEGSALAERIFSGDEVETVLVLENHLVVTRKDKTLYDWKEFAKAVGCSIRSAIEENGEQLISTKILESMPSEDEIRSGIQKSIDDEVNPGVAGHGGLISLLNVHGNTITIKMGGGCQGCSAADLTLKQGIHTTFRKAVPQVGAILDETDHSAGLNPYFS
jgi:Fe-S cluster biogenesis protein NfuA